MYTQSQIIDLLEDFRAAGFRVGVDQHIKAQLLLVIMSIDGTGNYLSDEETFRRYLAPLLCKSPDDQNNYLGIFQRWSQLNRRGLSYDLPVARTEVAKPLETITTPNTASNSTKSNKTNTTKQIVVTLCAFLLLSFLIPWLYENDFVTENLSTTQPIKATEIRVLQAANQTSQNDTHALVNQQAKPATAQDKKPKERDATPGNLEKIYNLTPYLPLSSRVLLIVSLPILIISLSAGKKLAVRISSRYMRIFIKRQHGKLPQDLDNVDVGIDYNNLTRWLRGSILEINRNMATQLGRPLRGRKAIVDVKCTANATARRAGVLELRFKRMDERPGYLMLCERIHADDQVAGWYDHWVNEFRRNGLPIDYYFFASNPRICWHPNSNQIVSLAHLAALQPNDRLLIFSGGQGFCDLLAEKPYPWVIDGDISTWQERFILTPLDPCAWGRREQILSDNGFLVIPANNVGLNALVGWISTGEAVIHFSGAKQAPYPISLIGNEEDVCSPEPPSLDLINSLITDLRNYLGMNGFHWLAACAVFPIIRWELALELGRALLGDRDTSTHVLRLVHLPWFRRGAIPDWFRLRLLLEIGPIRESQARRSAVKLLDQDDQLPDNLKLPVFSHCTEPQGSADEDIGHFITAEILSGKSVSSLSLPLPEKWRPIFEQAHLKRFISVKSLQEAIAISRYIDCFILLIFFLVLAGIFHLHTNITIGDWEFWIDWKDRRVWTIISPVMLIIFPAIVQPVLWQRFRAPWGATFCALALLFGEWIGRYFNIIDYPINMIAPSLIMPGAVLLDITLLLTSSFLLTGIIGATCWGLIFYPTNWSVIAAHHVPVTYNGILMSIADIQGYNYVRAGLPEYLRWVERGTIGSFGQSVVPVSAFFSANLCVLVYALGYKLGQFFSNDKFLHFSVNAYREQTNKTSQQGFASVKIKGQWGSVRMTLMVVITLAVPFFGILVWVFASRSNRKKGRILLALAIISGMRILFLGS